MAALTPMLSHMVRMMRRLVWRVRPRPCRQGLTMGPSLGCSVNHWWNFSDDFAKHHAASNKKGVVGSSGSGIPATPKATRIQPSTIKQDVLSDIEMPSFNFTNCFKLVSILSL